MTLSREDALKLQEFLTQLNGKTHTTQRTTEVVSIFGYLIGVRKNIFENPNEPLQMECYERLTKEKAARIVRNLCILRTSIEHNFGKINDSLRNHYRSITSLPEYIPQDSLMELENDGISVFRKSNTKLGMHIIELNRLIGDRINNCRDLFPTWLNWDYVKGLFIMPEGLTEAGIKAGADEFFTYLERYPYGVYIDEFHSARSEGIKMDSLYLELSRYITEHLQFNFQSMLNAALTATRIDMKDAEKRQFFDKHIRPFQAAMDKEGQLQITLKK